MSDAPSPSSAAITCDVCIVGSGVAALWTAAHLARSGHSVIIVRDGDRWSGAQTLASQGIIHGGIKYALTGAASRASLAISQMPETWAACIRGDGPLDLRTITTLSPRQWMWSTQSLASRFTALIGSKAVRTPMRRVTDASDLCPGLRAGLASCDLYVVDEPVLDPRSIISALASAAERAGVRVIDGSARIEQGVVATAAGPIAASRFILAAGAGNAALSRGLGREAPMQTRPLHMVMLKGDLPEVYGHCVAGLSDKPRVTIGWQRAADGQGVWYVGGQIAESGVARSRDEQIAAAHAELRACIPWVPLDGAQWSTLRIDRAEGLTPDGSRPDEPVLTPISPTALAIWPTKLAFAPLVAVRAAQWLASATLARTPTRDHAALTRADSSADSIAPLPWDDGNLQWSTLRGAS